jgi:hypothetical protein
MKYVVDDKAKQINAFDERWYQIPLPESAEAGPNFDVPFPESWLHENYIDVPSVTTYIGDVWPKGLGYELWLQRAKNPYEEREEAAQKGTKVHGMIERLLKGESLQYGPETSIDEWERVMAWLNWWKKYNEDYAVEILAVEAVAYSHKMQCAGTIDLLASVNGKKRVHDWKTGKHVGDTAEIQVCAYHQMAGGEIPPLILQLLPGVNKKNYKEIKIESDELPARLDDFEHCRKIWIRQNGKAIPKYRSYPMTLTLKKEE